MYQAASYLADSVDQTPQNRIGSHRANRTVRKETLSCFTNFSPCFFSKQQHLQQARQQPPKNHCMAREGNALIAEQSRRLCGVEMAQAIICVTLADYTAK